MAKAPVYYRIQELAAQTDVHNDYARCGGTHIIAQPFYLAIPCTVYRCTIKSWYIRPGLFTTYRLYKATANGKPYGAALAETSLSPTGQRFYEPGWYHRFDFDTFPVLQSGYYTLAVAYPDTWDTNSIGFPIQQDPKHYPYGTAHKSEDSGATWASIPNANFLFQVWGWPDEDGSDRTKRDGNWYITDYQHEWTYDGCLLVLHTKQECHLIMRWSLIPPKKRPVNRIVRGAVVCRFLHMELVSYADVHQQEAGDTLAHTFILPDWPYCQWRYFFFYGTVAAELMPSATPFFGWHKDYQPEDFELREIFNWPEYIAQYDLPFIEQFTSTGPGAGPYMLHLREEFTW